jgi:hypothetical protein
MLVWKRILMLRNQIRQQKEWIGRCGGDLAGYIANYGDPGVPPLDSNGKPAVFEVPADKVSLFSNYKRLPEAEQTNPGFVKIYKKHCGDGGTAIYKADSDSLAILEKALQRNEEANSAAKREADRREVIST